MAYKKPHVIILMGVYNGACHLAEQLASIANQSHKNWHLVASDDGSTDSSLDILNQFARRHPNKVTLRQGPKNGFSRNYMSLVSEFGDTSDHICFADQDDIWLSDKLRRSLDLLSLHSAQPALCSGRHIIWYPDTSRQILSPKMTRPFGLANALIENVAPGNTMMLNPLAARLASSAARRTGQVFAHDWWLYLLITATGGTVCFDNDEPTILYRQHDRNQIGAGLGILRQVKRKSGILTGVYSQRIEGNLEALESVSDLLTPEALVALRRFKAARLAGARVRLAALRTVGPYRQRRIDTLGFWGAASLGRI